MKFIITVDTEADNQWQRPTELTLDNIAALPRFQALCQAFGFPPTYVVTHEVASDAASAAILRPWAEAGTAEIGAHLHPWSNPPYAADIAWERSVHRFPSELSDGELRAKLTELTEAVGRAFGRRPTTYRAGRWGFDVRHITLLTALGYTADCSVTPHVSWETTAGGTGGGPDFRTAPVRPYWLGDDVLRPAAAPTGLLEVPMTILCTAPWVRESWPPARWRYPGNRLGRLGRAAFCRPRWLRVFPETTAEELQAVYRAARRNRLPFLQFMIHSSELLPGSSPYAKNKEQVEHTYGVLTAFFSFLQHEGISGTTVADFAASYRPPVPPVT